MTSLHHHTRQARFGLGGSSFDIRDTRYFEIHAYACTLKSSPLLYDDILDFGCRMTFSNKVEIFLFRR